MAVNTEFFTDLGTLLVKHGWSPPVGQRTDRADGAGRGAWQRAPRILISMLGFQNLALSRYCIESVLEHSTAGLYELRLTNNGSTDGTREYFDQMATQFQQIRVVHNDANEGFQKPNNEAFEYAKANGFEFLLLLNNDSTVPAGWLEKLLEAMDANPKCAIVGPLTGCSRVNGDMCGCDDTKLEFIEGSCAMMSVDILTKVRGSRPLFAEWLSFIYCEDLQISLDVQYAGYAIGKAPFRIQHRGSQTAGAHPEAKEKCAAANARNQAEMRKRYAHWNKVRRFDHPIIVRRTYASGDVLLTTPIIRALKKKYALCPIYVETGRPEIFENNQDVEKAYTEKSSIWHNPLPGNELFIDLDGAYEKNPTRHVLDSYAEAAGLEPSEIKWELEIVGKPKAGYWGADKFVGIHIGPTAWPGKNWLPERWNQVAQQIRARGYSVMLFGDGPKDAGFLVDMDYRGQQGFAELAALIHVCKLFIGLDSFPAHVATAVCTPAVVLYGVTNPLCFAVHTAPYRAVCSDPAHPDTGIRNRPEAAGKTFIETDDGCMRTITVEQVMAAVDELLAKGGERPQSPRTAPTPNPRNRAHSFTNIAPPLPKLTINQELSANEKWRAE